MPTPPTKKCHVNNDSKGSTGLGIRKVTVNDQKIPIEVGDMISMKYAQKGTIGPLLPELLSTQPT